MHYRQHRNSHNVYRNLPTGDTEYPTDYFKCVQKKADIRNQPNPLTFRLRINFFYRVIS